MLSRLRRPSFTSTRGLSFGQRHLHTKIITANGSGTESLSASSQNLPSIDQRLSYAKRALNEHRFFGKSCLKIHEYYRRQNALFVADLTSDTRSAYELSGLLKKGFRNSKAIRAMFYQGLLDLILQKKYGEFCYVIRRMYSDGLVSEYCIDQMPSIEKDDPSLKSLDDKIPSVFIEEVCKTSGEPLLAASFALQLSEKESTVKLPTILQLIHTLASTIHLEPSFIAYTIMKLINLHGHEKIPIESLSEAVLLMTSEQHVPFHANYLYDLIFTKLSQHESFTDVTFKLIKANLLQGHLYRAQDLWSRLLASSQDIPEHGLILLKETLLKVHEEDQKKAVELLRAVPQQLQSQAIIIDTAITILGTSEDGKDDFARLSGMLKAPLSRTSLSSLLKSFLYQNNESASEKVLQAIFRTPSGLNSNDFEAIIETLLQREKLKESVGMCSKNKIQVSKLGYVRILDHLLNFSDMKLNQAYFKLFCRQIQKLPKNDVASYRLTSTLIRFFSTRVRINTSKSLYLKFAYRNTSNEKPFFDFQKHGLPNKLNELILIDDHNRLSCLNKIFSQAVKEKDTANIYWCLSEFKSLGLSSSDIMKHYLNIDDPQAKT